MQRPSARHSASIFFLCTIVAASAVFSQPRTDTTLRLPRENHGDPGLHAVNQLRLSHSPDWLELDPRGEWKVLWNETTRTPHRAFGPALDIIGFDRINLQNVIEASRSFLLEHRRGLGIDPARLRLVRVSEHAGKWYVSYVQEFAGIEVLFSEVELRISDRGRVMAFGVDFHSGISLDVRPRVQFSVASIAALAGLGPTAVGETEEMDPTLYILPVESGGEAVYHLVYRIAVRTSEPGGRYFVFVDAHDGEVVWRYDRVFHGVVEGAVSGDVHIGLPGSLPVARPFSGLRVSVGDRADETDAQGSFIASVDSTATLRAWLVGSWVQVANQAGKNAFVSMDVAAEDTVSIHWNNGNSHIAERDVYYHVGLAHDFLRERDPLFTNLDGALPVRVNLPNVCNAWFDGGRIYFATGGGGCVNAATSASVVYHEYGHWVNQRIYQQAGSSAGMLNPAAHEALADILASAIDDDPVFARGFWGPGSYSRNLNNQRRYPEDMNGQEHNDGLVLGGAYWDLRQATSIETAFRLFHFARWGTPDDLNTGIAYNEWFVEVLVADDDDGDLGNGTPNFDAINQAFDAHGIGLSLFSLISFSHDPPSDLPKMEGPLRIRARVWGGAYPEGELTIWLNYSTDGFRTTTRVQANEAFQDTYDAFIPPQPPGTLVKYFFTVDDAGAGSTVNIPYYAPEAEAYDLLVGSFEVVVEEYMESDSGWESGALGDQATRGQWEREIPQQTRNGAAIVQPGADHSLIGSRCFVTGPLGGLDPMAEDVDAGRTTLLSPEFDLSGTDHPVVSYWKWYTNNIGPAPGLDTWSVDISDDGGLSWVSLEQTLISTNAWRRMRFMVTNYVEATDRVRLRFVAADFNAPSLVEGLVDDLMIVGTGTPPTPVVVLEFSADPEEEGVRLAWRVHGERNQTLFRIFRSPGRRAWAESRKGRIAVGGDVPGVFSESYTLLDPNPLEGWNTYHLTVIERDGSLRLLGEVEVEIEPGYFPQRVLLAPPMPNPFSPPGVLRFEIPGDGPVRLAVYDMSGRLMKILRDEPHLAGGVHNVSWNGYDDRGRRVANGVYILRLEALRTSMTRRLVLVR